MTKMTYVTALNTALTALSALEDFDPQVIARLTDLRDQTAKRNANPSPKQTAKQIVNQGLADRIKAVLSVADQPMTVTEIMAGDDVLAVLSNQKVSAVINRMGDEVVKITDKRVSKFRLA